VYRDGLSIRTAQQVMLETYAVRRSVGAISNDLAGFECASRAADGPPKGRAQPEGPCAARGALRSPSSLRRASPALMAA
jgi:hypothetical protein